MADRDFDVAIAGAGPAGCSTALTLRNSGLRVALIDKDFFPRDKICGDAIPSTAFRVLESIDPTFSEKLNQFSKKVFISGCRIVSPSKHVVNLQFMKTGYASARLDFDNFLIDTVKQNTKTAIFQGFSISDIQQGDLIKLVSDKNESISCKTLIGCDGAHSVVAKKLGHILMDRKHHIGAVRAYYKNIEGIKENELEIHLIKGYMPGYFWIFPLTNGMCNVGYGMVSKYISERKINLKNALHNIISTDSEMKKRFASAELIGDITGYGLPLGSRKVNVSGERFLLTGDAASLINPATGEGIGNAMRSGKMAADHAMKCFKENNFSAGFNEAYDIALYKKLWKDLRIQYWFQRAAGDREWLLDFALKQVSKNDRVKNYLSRFF